MKTTVYNMEKATVTLMMVIIISTFCSAATKGREILTHVPVKSLKASNLNITGASMDAKMEALSETLQDWMSNGAYWESERTAEVSTTSITNELEQWMKSGSYWNEVHSAEPAKESVTASLKSWMANGLYWTSENCTTKNKQ